MVLTYLAQRYVLQHLEANRRFLFAARCPPIFRIDKRIPLQISSLRFSDDAILINEICFRFSSYRFQVQETAEQRRLRQSKALRSGEVLLKVDETPIYSTYVQVTYQLRGESLKISRSRRLPAYFKDKDEALSEFLGILLRGRRVIKIGWLNIYQITSSVIKIPRNCPRLHVRSIHMYQHNVTRIKKLLDHKSFPLNHIMIYSWEEAYGKDRMITEADCVGFVASRSHNSTEYWYEVILKARNRMVKMWKLEFSMEQILDLIGNLVEKGRYIGSGYVLECSELKNLKKILKKAKERYGGAKVTLVEPKDNETIATKVISIPFATPTESEIVVYGIEVEIDGEKKKKKYKIIIKVMKKGSTTSVAKKKKKIFGIPWFN